MKSRGEWVATQATAFFYGIVLSREARERLSIRDLHVEQLRLTDQFRAGATRPARRIVKLPVCSEIPGNSKMWQNEWVALAARVDGLLKAQERVPNGDAFRITENILIPQTRATASAILAFATRYRTVLPTVCAEICCRHIEHIELILSDGAVGTAVSAIVVLACLRYELDYAMRDNEVTMRSSTERAFEHLQRLLVVDQDLRERWSLAFEKGEVACERLGAVHLLWHGIWAFKVDAAGERTDLVLGERVDIETVAGTANGLVLTEWKKVTNERETMTLVARAEHQAERYAAGSASPLELRNVRYVVCVSAERLKMPGDRQQGEVLYRHINVAIRSSSPSVTART